MRQMPRFIHADPTNGGYNDATIDTQIGALPRDEFNRRLEEIGGRALTAEELARVEKMSDHNWALRVQADRLFGSAIVDAYFAAKLAAMTA